MKRKPKIYIEGKTTSRALRQGFSKLLKPRVKKCPKIVLSGSKEEAIKEFFKDQNSFAKYLLIDLDASEDEKDQDIRNNALESYKKRSFYMIQAMEGWFLSQRDQLNKYWNTRIFDQLPAKHGQHFEKPDEVLSYYLKTHLNKSYKKGKDAAGLLQVLDPVQLEADFVDFKELTGLIKKEL